MKKLSSSIEQAFTDLVKAEYYRDANFDCYFCGGVKSAADFRPDWGLWTYDNVNLSRNYEGRSVQDFKNLPGYFKHPHYLKMTTKGAPFKVADFQGGSFQPIMEEFGLSHEEATSLMTEWARKKNIDIIQGTNQGREEVVIVNPASALTIVDCQDLLTHQWLLGGPLGVVGTISPVPPNQTPAPTMAPAPIPARMPDLKLSQSQSLGSELPTRGSLASRFMASAKSYYDEKFGKKKDRTDENAP
ncbi:hypothetical protein IFT48_01930 [Pseudomonas fluorescens]|uniref:hypothetical protein n=1 Tax=Pseudomonas fluorescens TaxID=294 RepID=UPI001930CB21|nr:hypothetical protein [Pseudomonas fluorescens]MBD8088721.1 hypothetical protein [Pseudomonas fluorescens]